MILKKNVLFRTVLCGALFTGIGALAPVTAAEPITITKGAVKSFIQPTLKIQSMTGNPEVTKPMSRYLMTCGWFRVVASGEADYTLVVKEDKGTMDIVLSFAGNVVFNKRMTFSGDSRRAAARAVDELITARFKQKLCDSRIVFTAETRPGIKEVFVCDTDGGNLRKVTEFSTSCVEPSWMPNSQSVVYTRYTASGTDVCETMLNPWKSRRLTTFPGMNVGAAVHPGGNFLALVMSIDRQVELYVKALNSRDRRRLTTSKAVEASPAWHPSGSYICFVSDKSGKPKLYTIAANGGEMRAVPTVGSESVTPAWAPDGKLAYAAKVGGNYTLAIYDPKGVDTGVIPKLPGGEWEAPSWAPDSRHLVASRKLGKKGELYIVDSKTGEIHKLLNMKYSQSSPDWSDIRRD